jgi:hypothetical protein
MRVVLALDPTEQSAGGPAERDREEYCKKAVRNGPLLGESSNQAFKALFAHRDRSRGGRNDLAVADQEGFGGIAPIGDAWRDRQGRTIENAFGNFDGFLLCGEQSTARPEIDETRREPVRIDWIGPTSR